MKLISLLLLICLCIGCATTKKPGQVSRIPNGTWVPIQQEIGGKVLPKAAFEKQKLIMSGNNYTVIAESMDKGEVKYSGDKMDIHGKEGVNTGKHFTAIYKLENGQLTICYNLSGDSYPESFETKSKPMFFLSVFKKE